MKLTIPNLRTVLAKIIALGIKDMSGVTDKSVRDTYLASIQEVMLISEMIESEDNFNKISKIFMEKD